MQKKRNRVFALIMTAVLTFSLVTPSFSAYAMGGMEGSEQLPSATATLSNLPQAEMQTASPAALTIVPNTAIVPLSTVTEQLNFVTNSASRGNAIEGWDWNEATNTLTLNGFNMEISSFVLSAVLLPAYSTIILADGSDNVIRAYVQGILAHQ